jgi:glycosyltransferase involved in cell wall biosynthesis/GT2 family glycosyltransferase
MIALIPKISVIMSVYNDEKYLKEAVESILNQTYSDFEFIIVNDGSTDNTKKILHQFSDPRIKIINNEKNIGLTKSLNIALKSARGEYIARMDGDDISHPLRFEKQVAFLEKHQECLVLGTFMHMIDENGNKIGLWGRYENFEDIKTGLLIQNEIGHGSTMLRRSAIEKVGYYDENFLYAQDYDLWLRLSEIGELRNLPEKLYSLRFCQSCISIDKGEIQRKYALMALKNALIRRSKDQIKKNNIKHLSIVHINTDDIAGGAAKVAWNLSENQRIRGHSSKMLVKNKRSNSGHSFPIPYETETELRERCYNEGWLDYEFQKSYELANHPLIQSANILHFHNLHGGYFSPFAISSLSYLKPVVWTLHDMQSFTGHCAHSFDCEKWQTGCGDCPDLTIYPGITVDSTSELWKDKKFIYEHSKLYIVTPSEWLKSKVEKSILSNHQIELIYNGVDTEVFKPYPKDKARKEFGLHSDKLLIGNVSNGGILMSIFKGGAYVLKAMGKMIEKFPNCEFLNIGAEGDSGIPYIRNIPPINDEKKLAKLYSALDIFLFTSLAENCPLAIIEAMSCGLPIVSFATGGVPEIIRDGIEGLVVETKDTDALISSLTGLAFSPDLREQFGKSARQRACEMFDIKKISKQYEELYLRIEEAEEQRHIKINREIEKIQGIIEGGELNKANELLANSVISYPDSPELIYMQAEANVKSGNIAKGKAILLDLVRLWPMNYVFLSNLALIYWEEGNYKIAEEYFIDALKSSQFNRSVILPYGQMLLDSGNINKARKLFETYLRINPFDHEILSLAKKTEIEMQK